jgi:hypothetical protein
MTMAVEQNWPKDVRRVSLEQLDHLGVDSQQRLYWDGKRIKTGLDLTWPQTIGGLIIAVATVLAALGSCIQGWTAYHEWACKVHWPVAAKCPSEPEKKPPN